MAKALVRPLLADFLLLDLVPYHNPSISKDTNLEVPVSAREQNIQEASAKPK